MFQIPEFINIFLEDNTLKCVDLIQYSTWKKTYILKIKNDDKYFILKACSDDSPNNIKNKILAEIKFYKNKNKKYLPKFLLNTKNILVLEYIEGVTLRECLIAKKISKKIIINLFNDLNTLYLDNRIIEDDMVYNFDNAFSHLSALLQSGPIQTKKFKVSIYKKIINKFYFLYLKIKLKYILKNINTGKLKNGFIHGDFHYNNILVSEENVKFIDFENIQYNGYFDFDILYLFVMIERNIVNDETIKNFYLSKLKEFLNLNKDILKVYYLYKIAISKNDRFHTQIV